MSAAPSQTSVRRVAIEVALVAPGFALPIAKLDPNAILLALVMLYGVRLVFYADRAQRWFFCGFGLVWAGVDIAFVRAGIFAYAKPGPFGPPSYMPLVFAELAVLVGEVVAFVDARTVRSSRARPPVPLPVDLALLGGATGAVLRWHQHAPVLLAVLLSIALVIRAAVDRFAARGLALALLFGVGEPLLESTLIALGLFSFSDPAWLGIPVWYAPFFAFAGYGVAHAFGAAIRSLRPAR